MHAQDSIVFYSGFEENVQPVYTTYHISEFNTKWFSAWQSPDIFSSNYAAISNSVPSNMVGYQNPLLGESFAGFTTIAIGGWADNQREWLGAKLLDSLIVGQTYCIKFSVSLADTMEYASDNIGFLFHTDSLYTPNIVPSPLPPFPLSYDYVASTPHSLIYNSKEVWTKIEIHYTAKGGEKYMYIGNFYPDSLTNYQYVGTGTPSFGGAYYYIDEVTVYKCDGVGIQENKPKKIAFYPNPATNSVSVDMPTGYPTPQLYIYNLPGQLVATKPVQPNQPVPITELSAGMYIFAIQSNNTLIGREKVVVY